MTKLDDERLLNPIEGDSPCGADLRSDYDSLYHKALAARDAARRVERSLDTAMGPDGQPRFGAADVRQCWKDLQVVAIELLESESKDMHVVAWLIEAELRLDGFDGLKRGFDVACGLVEGFWDGLHPQPSEDPDPDEAPLTERLRHLSALNGEGGRGTLIVPLSLVPLATDAEGGDVTPYTLERATSAERSGSTEQLAAARRALGELSVERLIQLAAGPGAALTSIVALDRALTEHSPVDAPPISALRDALEQIERNLRYALEAVPNGGAALAALNDLEGSAEQSPGEDGSQTDGDDDAIDPISLIVPVPPRPGAAAEPPTSREDAVRQLRHAANWFRQFEPHSPISYACERTVRWTTLTLPELMSELIDDDSVRGSFYRLTGIANNDDGS